MTTFVVSFFGSLIVCTVIRCALDREIRSMLRDEIHDWRTR